jgi:hypothetical protein
LDFEVSEWKKQKERKKKRGGNTIEEICRKPIFFEFGDESAFELF